MKFTKMHGIGNDYIYVNGFDETIENPSEVSIKVSDRHFGIGGDGLVIILPSETADFRMRMFNADGSEGKMCGNAIRCIAKYVYDRKMTNNKEITIETLSGTKRLILYTDSNNLVERVRVWMGQPLFSDESENADLPDKNFPTDVSISEATFSLYCVSMGNPHAVTFVEGVSEYPIEKIGTEIQKLAIFPNQVNVEFISILSNDTLKMRVWERGSGETLACGTGACASAAVAMRLNLVNKKCQVQLVGGNLDIEWLDDGIYMTGSATEVFSGEIVL